MLTSLASFHPGHGVTSPGTVIHYIAEPVHAISIAFAVVVLVVAAAALWRLALRKA